MPVLRYIHKRRAIASAAGAIMFSQDRGSEGMTNFVGQEVPFWACFEDHRYFSPSSVVHMQIGPQVELNPAQPSIDLGFLLAQKNGSENLPPSYEFVQKVRCLMEEFFGSEVRMFVQGSMLWGVETEESDMDFNFLVDGRKVTQEDRDQLARYLAQKLPQDHKVRKGSQSPCIHIYLPQGEKMDITPRNATYYDFFTATLPHLLGTSDRLEADVRLLEFFHLNPYARQGVQLLKKMFVNTTRKLPSYVMTHLYEQISRRFLTWDQFDGFTRVQSKEEMFEVLCETLREIGRFPALDATSPLKRLLQDDKELPSPRRLKLSLERSIEVMGDVVKQGKDLNAKLKSLVVSIMKDKRFDEVFTTVPPSTRSPFASWMDAKSETLVTTQM